MLYETLFQAKIFLSIMYFGIISALVYEILHLIKLKKYFLSIIQDFIFMLVFSCLFIFSVHIFCYGEFRFYCMIAFLVGFLIERKTIGKFVALFLNMIYNVIVKIKVRVKNTKLCKFISSKLIVFKLKIKQLVNNLKNKRVKEE